MCTLIRVSSRVEGKSRFVQKCTVKGIYERRLLKDSIMQLQSKVNTKENTRQLTNRNILKNIALMLLCQQPSLLISLENYFSVEGEGYLLRLMVYFGKVFSAKNARTKLIKLIYVGIYIFVNSYLIGVFFLAA